MMSLSLNESAAVNRIVDIIYRFLPGTPHPYGAKHLSFPAVAHELGLGSFWTGGSKRPAISRLLELTLEQQRDSFCKLMIEVVRRGVEKCRSSNPVTRTEVESLNKAILGVRFRIPEFHDTIFLESLPNLELHGDKSPLQAANRNELLEQIIRISELAPQPRGYAFEKALSGLFASCGLASRGSFRNDGEQIDGSFELKNDPYLLEAKWQKAPVGLAELLTFQGKVEGKAAWTRGLFVSYSGFSGDGLKAFRSGRPTRIICMDGFDLWQVIDQGLSFIEVLSRKARRASESNEAFVGVRDLFPERKQ